MTPSIPSTSFDKSNAGPAPMGSTAAALLGMLTGSATPTGGAAAPPAFLQFLGRPAATGPAPVAANPALPDPAAIPASPGTAGDPFTVNCLAIGSLSASELTGPVTPVPAKSPATAPTREQLEAAAALLAPLWQMLQALPAKAAADGAQPVLTVQLGDQPAVNLALPGLTMGGSPAPTPEAGGKSASVPAAANAPATVALEVAGVSPAFLQSITAKIVAALDQNGKPALAEPIAPAAPGPTSSALAPTRLTTDNPTPANPVPAADPTAALQAAGLGATIALPGGQVLRARIDLSRTVPTAPAGLNLGAEKIAADSSAAVGLVAFGNPAGEKNFLSDGHKQVGPDDPKDGIAVALPGPVMTATLFERETAAENAVQPFAAVDRSAFSSPADAVGETLPTGAMAHRAVAAVMSAVEAQTVSRLQPAPSVHLRLNLGGEDLSINVSMRNGEVHTEFQTNSADLHSAIAREWQAVGADSPDRALRFLEPVYAAGNPGGQGGSGFGQQGQSSQQYSRPGQQDVFGSVGRAYPFRDTETDFPERAAPVFQPTSLHLSAVA